MVNGVYLYNTKGTSVCVTVVTCLDIKTALPAS